MNETSWLIELENMCIHFSDLGVVQRITDMTLSEKWGLYKFLQRLV